MTFPVQDVQCMNGSITETHDSDMPPWVIQNVASPALAIYPWDTQNMAPLTSETRSRNTQNMASSILDPQDLSSPTMATFPWDTQNTASPILDSQPMDESIWGEQSKDDSSAWGEESVDLPTSEPQGIAPSILEVFEKVTSSIPEPLPEPFTVYLVYDESYYHHEGEEKWVKRTVVEDIFERLEDANFAVWYKFHDWDREEMQHYIEETNEDGGLEIDVLYPCGLGCRNFVSSRNVRPSLLKYGYPF